MNRMKSLLLSLTVFTLFFTVQSCQSSSDKAEEYAPEWQQLFNGKDLDDWIIKIRHQDAGVNYKNTFIVKDGKMAVNYDEYEDFDQQYGHIFYKKPFSAYYLAVEYRFVGEQAPGGEGWAWRKN